MRLILSSMIAILAACSPDALDVPNDGGPPGKPLGECATIADETTCNSNFRCVAVYQAPFCHCLKPGCCMQFDHCADDPVQCFPDKQPACPPNPVCKSGYSFVYDGGCAVGCVADRFCQLGD
jgi:hypothetical protein